MTQQDKAKVVVLGTDHPHVFALANAAKTSPQTQLVGVFDLDPQRRAAAVEKLGVPGFVTAEEALATAPALALIGAVPSHRADLAVQAVTRGAAVLVDKPLALTREALDNLRQAARQHRRQVTAFYPYRGHPLVLAAKAALDAGKIGRLVRVFAAGPHKLNADTRPAWHWTRADNGGALIDIGSHHADLVCWLVGEAPNWISATHGNLSQPDHPEFQDFAQAQLRFPSGAFGHIEVDWLNPTSMKHFGDTRFWIQGTTGKIELRLGDEISGHIWTSDVAAAPLTLAPGSDHADWEQQLVTDLALGRPGAIPQEDVWLVSEVTLAAFESAERGGQPVTLDGR